MDKILALNYLAAAAAAKSLSGAARAHAVSVPAVARMINALEEHLGIALFERSARGLTLTAAGTGYLAACAPLVAKLAAADDHARSSAARLKGTLVVGVQEVIAKGCLLSALPIFHGRYPDIEIDVRDFLSVTDDQVSGVDVMLMIGWPKAPDLVCRRIGESRFVFSLRDARGSLIIARATAGRGTPRPAHRRLGSGPTAAAAAPHPPTH